MFLLAFMLISLHKTKFWLLPKGGMTRAHASTSDIALRVRCTQHNVLNKGYILTPIISLITHKPNMVSEVRSLDILSV